MTGFRAHTFETTAERLFTNICLGKKKSRNINIAVDQTPWHHQQQSYSSLLPYLQYPQVQNTCKSFFFQTIQQYPIFVPVSSKICEGRHHECRTIARGLIIERIMKPQKYLKFKRTHTDHQVQPLAPYWTTQNQPLCLRALFKCCLNPSILVLWPLPLGTCI